MKLRIARKILKNHNARTGEYTPGQLRRAWVRCQKHKRNDGTQIMQLVRRVSNMNNRFRQFTNASHRTNEALFRLGSLIPPDMIADNGNVEPVR